MNESEEKLDTLIDILVELTTTGSELQLENSTDKQLPFDRSVANIDNNSLIQEERESKLLDLLASKEQYNLNSPEPTTNNNSLTVNSEEPKLSIDVFKSIDNLEEKQIKLENKINESIDNLNALLPLIEELMSIKSEDYRSAILKIVKPILDEIIEKRYLHNSQKMESVIAPVLPKAISQEIDKSPKEIAKALAPEIAYSIEEQIKIDRNAISRTLGPEMGKAIKTQIELEKDAMVDALYPVIGNTISKYMAEAIKSINDRVENTFSLAGIKRKIVAKIKGVSEAELILAEAIDFRVKGVFLIAKNSGLIIEEVQSTSETQLESEMLGGMLTAIRSFVNDCIFEAEQNSELNEIEYSDSKILLEVAGYCYLAVIIKGEPSKKFVKQIRETLSKIILNCGLEIENFNGDRSTISPQVKSQLEKLITISNPEQKSKPPTTFIILTVVSILAIASPLIYFNWRNSIAQRIELETSVALDSAPELSVYRLIPQVKDGKLILSGRVPNQRLRQLALEIGKNVAIAENLSFDDRIIAVKLPPDLVAIEQEVKTIANIFNFREEIKIAANFEYSTRIVTLKGSVSDKISLQQILLTYQQIPGVEVVVSNLQINLPTKIPTISSRIYFNSGSISLSDRDINNIIKPLRDLLDRNPKLHLRIIGHSDGIGNRKNNQKLAVDRAKAAANALTKLGVKPERLKISGSNKPPPDVSPNAPLSLSRCVLFEAFIPNNKK